MLLYNMEKGRNFIIDSLPNKQGVLRVLGLRRGIQGRVFIKQPLGGPVVIKVGRRYIAIAKEIAQQILVKEVG